MWNPLRIIALAEEKTFIDVKIPYYRRISVPIKRTNRRRSRSLDILWLEQRCKALQKPRSACTVFLPWACWRMFSKMSQFIVLWTNSGALSCLPWVNSSIHNIHESRTNCGLNDQHVSCICELRKMHHHSHAWIWYSGNNHHWLWGSEKKRVLFSLILLDLACNLLHQ